LSGKGRILFIEDNEALVLSNSSALEQRNYEVLTASTLAQAQAQLAEGAPDIILLDVDLPDGDGLLFCKEIREKTAAHILFFTENAACESIVRGLENGGDDYIAASVRPEELLARVDAAMRRRRMDGVPAQVIEKGRLRLDIVASLAFIGGEALALTPKEFSLLLLFAQNEGRVLSANQLYEGVWKAPLAEDKNAVQTAVSKLRKKMEASGYHIDSIRRQGYVFRLK
jgi:Response regulators consisting of a CheY-like receiver domain and a winged-helix DNA-binding domain